MALLRCLSLGCDITACQISRPLEDAFPTAITTNLTRPTARCGIIITPSADNRHEPDSYNWFSHWNGLRTVLYLLVLDGNSRIRLRERASFLCLVYYHISFGPVFYWDIHQIDILIWDHQMSIDSQSYPKTTFFKMLQLYGRTIQRSHALLHSTNSV